MWRVLGALMLLVGQLAFAGLDERIQVAIEEPAQGERYSGISNLRGWAVSPEGMGRYYLNVYVDGEFAFNLVPYGKRTDVGNAFPDYPDSDTGGFSMAYNYKNLSPGEHEIRVRAYDNAGNYNEAVTTFTAERFQSEFIASDSDVDVSTSEAWYVVDKQTYLVTGPTLEGQQWDFLLKWDRASQSFKLEEITARDDDGTSSGGDSGSNTPDVYACTTSPTTYFNSSSTVVRMKNGAELNNYDGRSWSTSESHIIFKATSGKWYTLENYAALYRIDLTKEPDSCFEPDYYFVDNISTQSDGRVVKMELSNGDTLYVDTLFDDCNISVVQKGAPIIYWESWGDFYFVDLNSAELCKV